MTEYPSETMTPKERYEYRKAVRKEQREAGNGSRLSSDQEADMTDMLDRFVTSVERIAEAMDTREEEKTPKPAPETLQWQDDTEYWGRQSAFGKHGTYSIKPHEGMYALCYRANRGPVNAVLKRSHYPEELKASAEAREAAIP